MSIFTLGRLKNRKITHLHLHSQCVYHKIGWIEDKSIFYTSMFVPTIHSGAWIRLNRPSWLKLQPSQNVWIVFILMFLKCSISQMEHFSNGAILKWSDSQMERFSNGAILKWSNSQMERFGVATLCHISRSQEQRNMACDVLSSWSPPLCPYVSLRCIHPMTWISGIENHDQYKHY